MKVFSGALIALSCLRTGALGELPEPGAPYRIQNVGSGLVFDNHNALTGASPFHINAFRINNDSFGRAAQRISVQQTGTLRGVSTGSAGLFTFSFPTNGLGAYVRGPPAAGLGLNVQNFSTEFTVLEVDAGVYTIAYPFSNFVVTSPVQPIMQLKLQLLNTSEPLQQWKFIEFET